MKKSTFKMFREENGQVLLDLEISREDEKFSIKEGVHEINKSDLTIDEVNKAFKAIGLSDDDQQVLLSEIDGETELLEVNDDIMDEFKDFFDFIGDVVGEIKQLGGK